MSRPGLWQQSDFLKLWTGQTVSQIRSAVSSPGIPLTALYVRHAPPGLTGILIDWITAPFAILTHAISFLFSAAAIELIRKSEPNPTPHPNHHLLRDIAEGIRTCWNQPILRALALRTVTAAFSPGMFGSLYLVYTVRDLHMSAALVGTIISVGGVGSLSGAFFATRTVRRFGLGPR
jgi:hypothetical protein